MTFSEKLIELDCALTGASHKDAARMNRDQPWEPGDFLERHGTDGAYYLSDGGYSRLMFSIENRKLFLTNVSTQSAFGNWKNATQLIEDVQQEIIQEGVKLGWFTEEIT